MGIAPQITVVEDEEALSVLLRYNLEAEGYEVIRLDVEAGDGCVACDIRDPDAVNAAAATAGPVDVLVNNAGRWLFDRLEDVVPADFAAVLETQAKHLVGQTTDHRGLEVLARGPIDLVPIHLVPIHLVPIHLVHRVGLAHCISFINS